MHLAPPIQVYGSAQANAPSRRWSGPRHDTRRAPSRAHSASPVAPPTWLVGRSNGSVAGSKDIAHSLGSMRRTPPRRHCDPHPRPHPPSRTIAWRKRASGPRPRRVVRRSCLRPNSAARLARTAPAARRLHSSRAIVPTGSEPAMPMATNRSLAGERDRFFADDRLRRPQTPQRLPCSWRNARRTSSTVPRPAFVSARVLGASAVVVNASVRYEQRDCRLAAAAPVLARSGCLAKRGEHHAVVIARSHDV